MMGGGGMRVTPVTIEISRGSKWQDVKSSAGEAFSRLRDAAAGMRLTMTPMYDSITSMVSFVRVDPRTGPLVT